MVSSRNQGAVYALLLLMLLLLVLGCGSVTGPLLALRPTSSPTPTLIPSPTSTLTPTPTPTLTPTPTPTPLPPSIKLELLPSLPQQGQTMLVRLKLDRAATASGDFDGQPVTFLYPSPTDLWALVPVPPWQPPGEHPLLIEVVAPDGQRARVAQTVRVQEREFAVQHINVPAEQAALLAPGLRQAEDRYMGTFLREVSPKPLWEGPFLLPAEGIRTSPYGARRSYQGGPPTGYHGGLDIAAPEGTPIYAAAAGRVVLAEELYVRGKLIMLDHGAGLFTLYFHLSDIAVEPGQRVEAGERIGSMGTTGLSTGSHLHWEVRVGGIFVDPAEWLEGKWQPSQGSSISTDLNDVTPVTPTGSD